MLKKTRWWDEGVFSHRVSNSLIIFLGRRDQSRGAADVQTCSVATKLYFCLSQFTWSANWCQLCKTVSSLTWILFTELSRLVIALFVFKKGVKRTPECKNKWNNFSFVGFQWDPEGVWKTFSFVNFKSITLFSVCLFIRLKLKQPLLNERKSYFGQFTEVWCYEQHTGKKVHFLNVQHEPGNSLKRFQ